MTSNLLYTITQLTFLASTLIHTFWFHPRPTNTYNQLLDAGLRRRMRGLLGGTYAKSCLLSGALSFGMQRGLECCWSLVMSSVIMSLVWDGLRMVGLLWYTPMDNLNHYIFRLQCWPSEGGWGWVTSGGHPLRTWYCWHGNVHRCSRQNQPQAKRKVLPPWTQLTHTLLGPTSQMGTSKAVVQPLSSLSCGATGHLITLLCLPYSSIRSVISDMYFLPESP